MEKIFEIKNLSLNFGKKKVLSDISFSVGSGDALGIIGKNGSGKTTLINALRGFISISGGEINFCGNALSKDIPFGSFGGAINDTATLDELLTGREAVYFAADMNGKSKAFADEIIKKCQMSDFANDKIKNYSLGMKKRTMIAYSLVSEPQILLLDEATSALDAEFIPRFRDILIEMREKGKIIIMCDHSLYEMQRICNKIAFLEKGSLSALQDMDNITESGKISLEDAFLCRIEEGKNEKAK